MSGIYLHIPFCKQKCNYCNFFSRATVNQLNDYVDALLKEIILQKNYLNTPVETIYLGGGTPSLLTVDQLVRIFDVLYENFNIVKDPEITIEVNPEGVTEDYINDLKRYTPINRFSIGIQSFHQKDLDYLNRIHSSQQARKIIETAFNAGFSNLTIDLIFGIPTLSDEKWNENLQIFFEYNLPHISCYGLTVEPDTLLSKQIEKKLVAPPCDETIARQMQILMEIMFQNDYEQYEISNFAKNNNYSKHNSNYWKSVHYLGLGASAHSFNGCSRQWNISDIQQYVNSVNSKNLDFKKEILTAADKFNEYIMTGLRTKWGISCQFIEENFGKEYISGILPLLKKYESEGCIVESNENVILSNKGKLFADKITADLFIL